MTVVDFSHVLLPCPSAVFPSRDVIVTSSKDHSFPLCEVFINQKKEGAFDFYDILHNLLEIGATDEDFDTLIGEATVSSFEYICDGGLMMLFFKTTLSCVFVASFSVVNECHLRTSAFFSVILSVVFNVCVVNVRQWAYEKAVVVACFFISR